VISFTLLWDIALIGISVLLAIVSVVTLAMSSLRSRRRRRRVARPPPVKFCRLCGTRLDRHQEKLCGSKRSSSRRTARLR
jgi:hypothetical protein